MELAYWEARREFLVEGRYAGSTEALVAMAAMHDKWAQRNA